MSARGWLTYLPAIVTALGVLLVALYVENLSTEHFQKDVRLLVSERLSLVRARLEGNINSNAQLTRGLVAAITTEPDMTQERFAALAAEVLRGKSQIRNIGAAPGLVIRLMYPLKGNEKALGLDYRKTPDQTAAALQARDLGELVLAGPVNLVQGGQGFIGRIPVFTGPEPGNDRQFWGLVSTVIDVERLYQDSGLLDPDLPIEIAIRGEDAKGREGAHFFGRKAVLEANPVEVDVILPWGSWTMAAIPKGGWPVRPDEAWLLYAGFLLAGLLIVAPMVVVGRLLVERRDAEQRLTRTVEALEFSNTELESFAYVASHDLREPLRNVTNYSTLLQRKLADRLSRDEMDYLKFIRDGATRMDHLVRDLLDFSRVGRLCEPMSKVSVHAVFDTVLGHMRSQLESSNAEVEITSALPTVMASRDELERVFLNLLGNALKYRSADTPPRIAIGCVRDGTMWRFHVQDNGIGIQAGEGYEERIFELFKRLHQREEHGGGTGVGLAICRKIIERYDGRIWIESPGLNQGSRFLFTLPVLRED